MSQTAWTTLVEEIHASGFRLALAATGGGSKAISQLLDLAGASRTMLEAIVPYSDSALEMWLGASPKQSCSEPTARAMAMAAWRRARQLDPNVEPRLLLGIGATASLASDRPKRGEHRIHVAAQTTSATTSYSLQLAKGSRDRKKEQWLAAKLILLAVGEACQVETKAAKQALNSQLFDSEPIKQWHRQAEAGWAEVLLGLQKFVVALPRSPLGQNPSILPQVVFPGAFHPPHAGHRRMAEIAAAKLDHPVAFELSITNVDKRPLDYLQLHERIETFRQWDPEATLLLTDAPTFRTKSAQFPGCTFVVGADTIARIASLSYYAGDHTLCEAAVQSIAAQGCRFLVFGRHNQGHFQGLNDLSIPDSLRALCEEVPESEFSEAISSTELRRKSKP